MPLSRQQREDLRVKLENRYTVLLAELETDRRKAGVPIAELQMEGVDLPAAIQATGVADAELGRDWHELEAVQSALARLDGDDYGVCVTCGSPIPWRRLMHLPAARRCLDCQQSFERDLNRA